MKVENKKISVILPHVYSSFIAAIAGRHVEIYLIGQFIVLTASIKSRRERFEKRDINDLHDTFMLSDPVRFAQVDSELLRLAADKLSATLVCTDSLRPEELLDYIWSDLQGKLQLCPRETRVRAS